MKIERTTIDGHIHLEHWFDENGTDFFELLDKLQKDSGVSGMNIASLTDKIYGGVEVNMMAALYKLHNPSAYAYAGLVYPEFPVVLPLPDGMDALTQYNELMEIGFDGIKILYKPDTQKEVKLPINSEFYEQLFAQAEKDKTPFLWHVADPEEFWSSDREGEWSYGDGTYPTYKELYEQVFDVIKRHPELKVTFAHFLFLSDRPEVLEYIFNTYKNVDVDITPGMEMYKNFNKDIEYYRDFFEKYSDRILFGSDATVPDYKDSPRLMTCIYQAITEDEDVNMILQNVEGLGLSDDACNKIFHANFLNKNTTIPKPINKIALKKYINKYLYLISNDEIKRQILIKIKEESI